MERFFTDRIENGVVICEDENGDEMRIAESDVKGDVKEGDVITKNDKGDMFVDAEATVKRRQEILELRKYIYGTKKEKTR